MTFLTIDRLKLNKNIFNSIFSPSQGPDISFLIDFEGYLRKLARECAPNFLVYIYIYIYIYKSEIKDPQVDYTINYVVLHLGCRNRLEVSRRG